MSRHFDIAFERMDRRFDAPAKTIANFDENIERKLGALDDRMERGFAETQAMIKFLHGARPPDPLA